MGVGVRERWLAGGCVVAATGAGWVLWDQLGIRALIEHLPQQYGPGQLTVAFLGAAVIWLCLHSAALVLRSRNLAPVHGAALALAAGAVAYLHWPQSDSEVGYFAVLTSAPSLWGRDVALLLFSLGAGLALPTTVALRRRPRDAG
jgi:hypothetical protein